MKIFQYFGNTFNFALGVAALVATTAIIAHFPGDVRLQLDKDGGQVTITGKPPTSMK
jgi:hypothetical protein